MRLDIICTLKPISFTSSEQCSSNRCEHFFSLLLSVHKAGFCKNDFVKSKCIHFQHILFEHFESSSYSLYLSQVFKP